MVKLKIGIVGAGAIGSSLAKFIVRDFKKEARLCALYDTDNFKARALSLKVSGKSGLSVNNLSELISASDLVIEAASARSSFDIAFKSLSAKRCVMIMSVGGVINNLNRLRSLALKNKRSIYIPSGAVCGIDALKAAAIGKLKKVTLVTTKSPLAFRGVKYVEQRRIKLEGIKKDTLLFCGSAERAVKLFPQNINVAAVLSLAGLGAKNTRIKIVASPKAKKNTHEIIIDAVSGVVYTRTENILHPDNPKTSYLAVLSAVATLKQVLEPIKIGT